ncbi:MAG: DUF1775 domain-containing protein [Candidatus Nanopelagicales bacterium]|nr:DUF1775 domain-containing protein [Candidatus Nanopelagicales bacterium]
MRSHFRTTALRTTAVTGLLVAGVVIASTPASAHMGIDSFGQTFTAGKGATVYFRPGHGCKGDATNAITVTLPDGVTGAKAQQKLGWTTTRQGSTITWSGNALPDSQFDDFGIRLTFPALPAGVKSQVLYFKAVQTCDAEIKVAVSGKDATITGSLPASAGKAVQLSVNSIPLTKHAVVVGADGAFTVKTSAAKVPAGSDVQARIDGVLVGNSTPGQEAWIEIPAPGSTASLASPAPTVTITA